MRDFRTPETSKLERVRALARDLLRSHGLADWKFRYDKAKARIGFCNYDEKIISLSEPITLIADDETILDTLLHEVAHALVGPDHHHNNVWRRKALSIGCSGERTCEILIRGKYRMVCPNGHEFFAHRKTKTVKSCGKCNPKFDERFILEWEN